MFKDTAILIFANSAKKEVERKPFLSNEICVELNLCTLKTVKKTNLNYFFVSENQQTGITFAERLNNAIQSIFNKGFKNVIAIGNDTPHLKTKHLLTALKQLTKKQIVIGPSKDGGIYLMGIKKEYFNKKSFLHLPWQTARLRKAITSKVTKENKQICVLELLNDIDSKNDIVSILNSFNILSIKIKQLLQRFIFINTPLLLHVNIQKESLYALRYFNKGSPLYI